MGDESEPLVNRTSYFLYYTRNGVNWYKDYFEYSDVEHLQHDWKGLFDQGFAKIVVRETTEKFLD